jgi:hypothetical protein
MIVDGNEAAFVMRVLRSGDEGGGGATLRCAGGEVEFQKLQMVLQIEQKGKAVVGTHVTHKPRVAPTHCLLSPNI